MPQCCTLAKYFYKGILKAPAKKKCSYIWHICHICILPFLLKPSKNYAFMAATSKHKHMKNIKEEIGEDLLWRAFCRCCVFNLSVISRESKPPGDIHSKAAVIAAGGTQFRCGSVWSGLSGTRENRVIYPPPSLRNSGIVEQTQTLICLWWKIRSSQSAHWLPPDILYPQ